jgi:hypothetical protein
MTWRKKLSDELSVCRYVSNAPTNSMDPSGLQKQDCCGVDITDNLESGLKRLEKEFLQKPNEKRREICRIALLGTSALYGWDIVTLIGKLPRELLTKGNCGTGKCQDTVTVKGECHWAFAVNYILYGKINRLCKENVTVRVGLYIGNNLLISFGSDAPDGDFAMRTLKGVEGVVKGYRGIKRH